MSGTGLLVGRCDPYGAESRIQLFGGIYPEAMRGKHMWHCEERPVGRFRMVCRGGEYGQRQAPDGGMVPAFVCEGNHAGQPMDLCHLHVKEFSSFSYDRPKPLKSIEYDAAGHPQHWAPGSVVGGSRANEVCPRCAMPPEARSLQEEIDPLVQRYAVAAAYGLLAECAKIESELGGKRAEFDMLVLQGKVHKCPLRLVEVS